MNRPEDLREAWLARLLDLLPLRETRRVRAEVEALIADRVEATLAEEPGLGEAQAVARALAALGDPEDLAERLVDRPLHVPLATRRRFRRSLAVLYSCHLLLAVVLTAAGARESALPALLGPLPSESPLATLLAVIALFFLDAGAVLTFLWLTRRGAPAQASATPAPGPAGPPERRQAAQGLLLVALLAVILNFFVETIFSIRWRDARVCFLSEGVREVLPWGNLLLGLLAVRAGLVLLGARALAGEVLDALVSLLGAGLLVALALSPPLVSLPKGSLGGQAEATLGQLLDRVLLFVCLAAALYLVGRGVRRSARALRLLHA